MPVAGRLVAVGYKFRVGRLQFVVAVVAVRQRHQIVVALRQWRQGHQVAVHKAVVRPGQCLTPFRYGGNHAQGVGLSVAYQAVWNALFGYYSEGQRVDVARFNAGQPAATRRLDGVVADLDFGPADVVTQLTAFVGSPRVGIQPLCFQAQLLGLHPPFCLIKTNCAAKLQPGFHPVALQQRPIMVFQIFDSFCQRRVEVERLKTPQVEPQLLVGSRLGKRAVYKPVYRKGVGQAI